MIGARPLNNNKKRLITTKPTERTWNMKKLLLAAMTTVAALALAGTAEAQDKLKACWVYVGPIGDFGYSYQHDQGRLQVEKALGDKVETAYLENVAEGPDAE